MAWWHFKTSIWRWPGTPAQETCPAVAPAHEVTTSSALDEALTAELSEPAATGSEAMASEDGPAPADLADSTCQVEARSDSDAAGTGEQDEPSASEAKKMQSEADSDCTEAEAAPADLAMAPCQVNETDPERELDLKQAFGNLRQERSKELPAKAKERMPVFLLSSTGSKSNIPSVETSLSARAAADADVAAANPGRSGSADKSVSVEIHEGAHTAVVATPVRNALRPRASEHDTASAAAWAQVERKRLRTHGGPQLQETLMALQVIAPETPSQEHLQHVVEAFRKDFHIELDTDSDATMVLAVAEADVFLSQDVRIRVLSQNGLTATGQIWKCGSGTWSATPIDIRFQAVPRRSRWQVTIIPQDDQSILEGQICNGRLTIGDITLPRTRTRAHSIPSSPWFEVSTCVKQAWAASSQTLTRLFHCRELQSELQQFHAWREELGQLKRLVDADTDERFVLFVGDTGAGKSKQINNLIGEGEILPSAGEGSSVTAAPVEIRFESAPGVAANAPAAVESYRVEFDLYTVDDFNHLRDHHAKELRSYWEDIFKQEQLDRSQRMANFQKRKLHAHQTAQKRQRLSSKVGSRSSSSQRVVQQEEQEPAEVAFTIRATKPPNDQDAKLAREAHDWLEAVFGTAAFNAPWSSIAEFNATFRSPPATLFTTKCKFVCYTQVEIGDLLNQYLVHNDECKNGQVWPLVKCAKLWGPWEILRGGCVFVDLPGSGDSNTVRNKIAQREFARADFVCICARIDRAATNKAAMDWLTKTSRDLPEGSAAFVCTKSDDVSMDEVIKKHKLPASTTRLQAALKRNEVIKQRMEPQYPHIPLFCVSARDYSRIVGFESSEPDTFFVENDTEIPALQHFIFEKMAERRVKKQMGLIEKVDATLQLMDVQLTKFPGVEYDGNALKENFDALLSCCVDTMTHQAQHSDNLLTSRRATLEAAARTGERASSGTLGSKARCYGVNYTGHWATHKAMVERNGVWKGMDVPHEISAPIVGEIQRTWADDFQAILAEQDRIQRSFSAQCKHFAQSFADTLREWPDLQAYARSLGNAISNKLEAERREHYSELSQRVGDLRKGCAEEIETKVTEQVARHLGPAKGLTGTGSSKLRKDKVTEHLPRMRLKGASAAPQARLAKAIEVFSVCSTNVVEEASQKFIQAFDDFWTDKYEEEAAGLCASKQALQRVLRAELPGLSNSIGKAKQELQHLAV